MKLWAMCLLTAAGLAAQVPRVGEIEFYGLHKISAERLLRALDLHAGDPLPPSKGDLEDRLEQVSGVIMARVEADCCDRDRATLFVGIAEKGAPHFALRSEPAGSAALPAGVVDTWRQFLEAVRDAARRGDTAEDLTRGYSMMADPAARNFQVGFIDYADHNLPLLRDVLRNSADEDQRAIAASLIGYGAKKQEIVTDLEYALQDPDPGVRTNAVRSLTALAVLARRRPLLGIRISSTWFVEMLNSLVLSDRLKAASALVTLTDRAAPETLAQIRERALSSVVEMARWKTLSYALPAFILVGRMAGLSEKQIQDAWTRGDREAVISRVLKDR